MKATMFLGGASDGSPGPAPENVEPKPEMLGRAKRCPACGERFGGHPVFCGFDGATLEEAGEEEATAGADPLLGLVVDGRYLVERKLGEGGMGTVYLVKHQTIGRSFALKVLNPDLAARPELAQRFTREASAIGRIKHPHVVDITDFGTVPDGRPYYAMEFLSGETLSARIAREGALPEALVAHLGGQIADALDASHAHGVIHRDLKPDNVFLVGVGDRPSARVVDFGAALIVGAKRMTETGIVFGSPHYMAPEQADGSAVDHRADVYALGIVLYEALVGRVPFQADTIMGVITQHMYAQPPLLPAPRSGKLLQETWLGPIVSRALAKDRAARFPDMAAFSAALRDQGRSTAARGGSRRVEDAPSPADRPAMWDAGEDFEAKARQKRVRSWGLGLCGVACAGVVGIAVSARWGRAAHPAALGTAEAGASLPVVVPAEDATTSDASLPAARAGVVAERDARPSPPAAVLPPSGTTASPLPKSVAKSSLGAAPKGKSQGPGSDFRDPWGAK